MSHPLRRVLFCDIDGVLTGDGGPSESDLLGLGASQMRCLKEILGVTGCHVVITSSWRSVLPLDSLRSAFARHGIPAGRVLGVTPLLDGRRRGDEIGQWLREHPDVIEFAILDDDEDADHEGRLVRTWAERGLTEREVAKVVAMFRHGTNKR